MLKHTWQSGLVVLHALPLLPCNYHPTLFTLPVYNKEILILSINNTNWKYPEIMVTSTHSSTANVSMDHTLFRHSLLFPILPQSVRPNEFSLFLLNCYFSLCISKNLNILVYKTHPFFGCQILGQKSASCTRDGTVCTGTGNSRDTASCIGHWTPWRGRTSLKSVVDPPTPLAQDLPARWIGLKYRSSFLKKEIHPLGVLEKCSLISDLTEEKGRWGLTYSWSIMLLFGVIYKFPSFLSDTFLSYPHTFTSWTSWRPSMSPCFTSFRVLWLDSWRLIMWVI